MIQQRERLYHLDKPGLAHDAVQPAPAQTLIVPPGWISLEQCNLSPVPGQALQIPYVLLHPEVGVALIDIAPGEALGAEEALRARLEAARFAAIFPGTLPIAHLQLQPEELGQLGSLLPDAFATLPRINLPGGDGWVSVVRRALAPRLSARGVPQGEAMPPLTRATRPPMLNREVAAQRAGLPPSPKRTEEMPAPRSDARWPGLPVALGLAGLAAVTAAAAVLWGGSRPTETPVPIAAAPERTGVSSPSPAPVTGGGPAAPVLPPAVPGRDAAAPAPPVRAPDIAAPPVAPLPRDRAAAPAPRLDAAPAPPPAAAMPPVRERVPPPPAPAVASDRAARVMVRTAANLRASPNNKAPILRTVPQGEVLREFSRAPDGWVEVGDTRPQGWIFEKLLAPARP